MLFLALHMTGLLAFTSLSQSTIPFHEIAHFSQKQPDPKLSPTEQKLLDLANAERKKANAPPLKAVPLLMNAARQHSANMATKGELNHELDGKGPAERLTDLGYQWRAVAENIALGQRIPQQAITTWMNSDGHRTNLLNSTYTEVGLALAKARDGSVYWTMVFALAK